ncbi:MAG: hypothetical protein QOK39_383 [Acidimicrobiaceae bacterium]|nr:hypothetical protein [Acidimicrobiaceae bacterium]
MSGVRHAAEEYLAVRRALGFKLASQGRLLLQFADFADASGASVITPELCLRWARQPAEADPTWWNMRLSVVRGFARHLHGLDPRTEVPARDVLTARKRRTVPHLYSPADIDALMNHARHIRSPLKAHTYETLIGLLAVTGMRVGEAIGLDRDDVDVDAAVVVVRCGKNGRSREIPVHPSTIDALSVYTQRRHELCARPSSASFLVSSMGTRLDYRCVWREFDRLRRQAGLQGRSPSHPPRLHDLRHSFVLSTLLNWYHSGVDIDAKLPVLSTYLGHVDPASSYWYFEAAPELLALAAERLSYAWETQT